MQLAIRVFIRETEIETELSFFVFRDIAILTRNITPSISDAEILAVNKNDEVSLFFVVYIHSIYAAFPIENYANLDGKFC